MLTVIFYLISAAIFLSGLYVILLSIVDKIITAKFSAVVRMMPKPQTPQQQQQRKWSLRHLVPSFTRDDDPLELRSPSRAFSAIATTLSSGASFAFGAAAAIPSPFNFGSYSSSAAADAPVRHEPLAVAGAFDFSSGLEGSSAWASTSEAAVCTETQPAVSSGGLFGAFAGVWLSSSADRANPSPKRKRVDEVEDLMANWCESPGKKVLVATS
eukprot:TRINITY_DN14585_c0_g1_i1.p1 TRINITY_DN14585_c0_g1~~TRINITY_DN14585_c0_g1_i1.p1  ORF type:complete len:213 (-),score=41.60 TRINITY_DN14585_c0_g1_i1:101-739(-)